MPGRVIARSPSDEAILSNEIAAPFGLAMTTLEGLKCDLFDPLGHHDLF